MFTENQIKGGITTIERQLLYEIRDLLKEQNELLRSIASSNVENNPETVKDTSKKRGRKGGKANVEGYTG